MLRTILLATTNLGKIRELSQMLKGRNVDVLGLEKLAGYVPPIEEGKTFADNAHLKAFAVRDYLHRLATVMPRAADLPECATTAILADDSGLECDGLQGAPGVDSAYFAGPKATDAQNNAKLARQIAVLPESLRLARYVCVLILLHPDGSEIRVEGRCEGRIITVPRGINGFGYDPYFFVPELGKTMAELDPDEKNRISHRGRALAQLLQKISGMPSL